MRVWLDPEKMSFRGLTASDVTRAIEQQNAQVAAGQIGQPPVPSGQVFQYTMSTLGRLATPEQFEEMILKTDPNGRIVRLRDVARIELGAQGYDQSCTLDESPSVALSIFQRPGSNALRTAQSVRDKMAELKQRFPEGLDYAIVYDTTPFIRESVLEVGYTLRDAVILVAVVVLLFLQSWRSAIIPLVAVPVAIIGTFAVMAAIGFSLNNLTLFGLVLAIGIVVDDAIVVVEAVEHHIEHGMSPRDATVRAMEQVSGPVVAIGLVLSAVFVPCAFITGIIGQFFKQFALTIATSTLISAFNSLTLSPALAALLLRPKGHGKPNEVLPLPAYLLIGAWAGWSLLSPWLGSSPALAHLAGWRLVTLAVLGGAFAGAVLSRPLNFVLARFFRWFNAGFQRATNGYTRVVAGFLRVSVLVMVVYGGLLYLTSWGFTHTPSGFIPQQDKGYLLVNVQMPDSTSLEQTQQVMGTIERVARKEKGVSHTVAIAGQSTLLNANAPNFGAMYVMLDEFHHRRDPLLNRFFEWYNALVMPAAAGAGPDDEAPMSGLERWARGLGLSWAKPGSPLRGPVLAVRKWLGLERVPSLSGDAIAARLRRRFNAGVADGLITVFGAPPVEGLGTAGGFKVVIEDRGDLGLDAVQAVADQVVSPAADSGAGPPPREVTGLYTSFRANTPWLNLEIDRDKLNSMGVTMDEVFNTLQVYLGSLYVNDFNLFGRTWQVNVQGEANYRKQIEDLKQLKIRSQAGGMVPLGALAQVRDMPGPVMIARYNMYPSAAINGDPAPGFSSGQGIDAMQEWVQKNLPPSMRYEWTELALLQLQTGVTAMLVFVLAVVLVFLVLAAQYESWSLPLAVILVVPMCLLCSIAGVAMARMDVNIFTQVGFVVLVGLACKNAILIVEFAKARREAGVPRREATLEACSLRLRPIMMTSFAFILGVVPLVLAEGAGAEMRRTLGTAVFAGMLGVTLFGIFLTPVFYNVIQWVSDRRAAAATLAAPGGPAAEVEGEVGVKPDGRHGGANGLPEPAATEAAGSPAGPGGH
jgi:multidrug efflux pump subunit AcrB